MGMGFFPLKSGTAFVWEGGGGLYEHVDIVCFGEGIHGGPPGDKAWIGRVEDGKVWFAEVILIVRRPRQLPS